LPNKKAAFRAMKNSKKKHVRNVTIKSELKTVIKKFDKLTTAKKTDEAKKIIDGIISKLSRAASKGVIHKNTASRKISRLRKRLTTLAKA